MDRYSTAVGDKKVMAVKSADIGLADAVSEYCYDVERPGDRHYVGVIRALSGGYWIVALTEANNAGAIHRDFGQFYTFEAANDAALKYAAQHSPFCLV